MPKKTVSAIMSAIFFAVTMTGCGSQVAVPAATEVTEAREAMVLPSLEGRTVEHAQYGQGTVSDQTDAVLTIEYARGTRKQKLPFVVASGCVTVDDKEATESCRKIQDLDNEQARLRKEIQYCESWISDLQKQS